MSRHLSKGTALALALIMALGFSAGVPAAQSAPPASGSGPAIFRLTDEIKPGEAFHIFGDGLLEASGVKAFTEVNGADTELRVAQYDEEGGYGQYIAAILEGADGGAIPAGVRKIWVEDAAGLKSGELWLNRARPEWVSCDIGYAGIVTQLIGVNFTGERFGAANSTSLRLADSQGGKFDAVITELEPYSIKFIVPDVTPGFYDIEVTNDGQIWSVLDNEQTFEVIPKGNDPLGLGVAWEVYYNYGNVIDVTSRGVVGDGATDNTAAVKVLMDELAVTGGGILYFPDGNYLVDEISIAAYTILQGESRGGTVITYTGNDNIGGHRAFFNTRRDAEQIGFQGLTNMTLRVSDDSVLPAFVFWLGPQIWGEGYNSRYKGFFFTNITADFPHEFRGTEPTSDMFSCCFLDRYFLIENTTQGGYSGMLGPIHSDYVTVRNNDYSTIATTCGNEGTYVVYENNTFTLDSEYRYDKWLTRNGRDYYNSFPAQGVFTKSQFYMAYNTITDAGSEFNNDGEIICAETNSGIIQALGSAASVNGNTMTLNKRVNPNGLTQVGEAGSTVYQKSPYGDTVPIWGYLVAAVLGGKGAGQYRRVTDISGEVYTLDKPWDVEPDGTSNIWIGNLAMDAIMYKNDASNCRNSYAIYGSSINYIIADNTGEKIFGANNTSFYCMEDVPNNPNDRQHFWPSMYTSYLYNDFSKPGKYSDTLMIQNRISYESLDGSAFGYNQFGMVQKGNRLSDAPNAPQRPPGEPTPVAPNGIGVQVVKAHRDPPHALFKAGIIEGNILTNMQYGVYLGNYKAGRPEGEVKSISGVVLKGNVYDNCTYDKWITDTANITYIDEADPNTDPGDPDPEEPGPQIFRLSDEVKPGDAFQIYGYNLLESEGIEVWSGYNGADTKLEIIQYDAQGSVITALLGKRAAPGAREVWVKDAAGLESARLWLNVAKPQWISCDIAYEDIEMQLIGVNMTAERFGGANNTGVRLISGGNAYDAVVTSAEPYSVKFKVPAMPLGVCAVEVSNDGARWVALDNEQTLTVIPAGTDPFDLGVAWEVNFNYSDTANVVTFGADPTGTADSTAAIKAAVSSLGNGGGIVYFPAGTYRTRAIELFAKTIVRGAGRDDTTIIFTGADGRNIFFHGLYTSWHGIIDVSLEFDPGVNTPNPLFYFGANKNGTEGLFIKNVNITSQKRQVGNDLSSQCEINRYLLIENTVQTGYRGVFSANQADYTIIRGNVYDVTEPSAGNRGMYTIIEGNTFDMNYGTDSLGITRFANALDLATHFYVANNTTRNIGTPTRNDGLVINTEWAGHTIDAVGTVIRARGATVRLSVNPASLNPQWGYKIAVIVDGKGMGQYRRVIGAEADSITLDKPFDITPDRTSKIIVGNVMLNSVVYGNQTENCKNAIQIYGGAVNVVVADNTGVDSYGVVNQTIVGADKRNMPSFFVSYLNNEYDGGGYGTGYLSLNSGVSYQPADSSSFGYSQYGLIIKRNALRNATAAGLGGGHALYSPREFGILVQVQRGGNDLPGSPLIKGVLIEGNAFDNMAAGVTVRVQNQPPAGADAIITCVTLKQNEYVNCGQQTYISNGVSYTVYEAPPGPDLSDLTALLADAEDIFGDADNYTAASIDALLEAMEAGYAVVENEGPEQADADQAAANLRTAINGVRPAALTCPVKSMLAKVAKLQAIPYSWDGKGKPSFASSNPAVCGVTPDGILIPFKAGIAVITLEAPNGAKVLFAVTVSA